MIYIRFENLFQFEYDIQALIRAFYPGEPLKSVMPTERNEACDESTKFIASFSYFSDHIQITVTDILGKELATGEIDTEGCDRKETKNRLKRLLYDILSSITGRELPWGTLSGIRPTKITSALLEGGMSEEEMRKYLQDTYYLSEEKMQLSMQISRNEQRILQRIPYRDGYSLYIGIPFCPTTCLYCSFTSYPIEKYRTKVKAYLDAVKKELEYISHEFSHRKLNTVYIGGGTPTTLEPDMLAYLLDMIHTYFNLEDLAELTVEAGRPDSITKEKLQALKQGKVTRISVNPQTMKEETLRLIGRKHTVEDVKRAFYQARELGFENINMDFIAGLPQETIEDMRQTMAQTVELAPDSMTMHSLAVKRAARLQMFREQYQQYTYQNDGDIMQLAYDSAAQMGMEPYYLYRQKNMAGNLENVGYATAGKEGIYNILIMEEKHPILAVGAGASTKLVYPDEKTIDRVENVKDVDTYLTKVDEMIERKKQAIETWRKF